MKNYLKPISMTFVATVLCISSAHAGAVGDFLKATGNVLKKASDVIIPVRRTQPTRQQPAEPDIKQQTQQFLQIGMSNLNGLKNTSPELSQAVLNALGSNSLEIDGVKIETQKLREIYSVRKNVAIWINNAGFSAMGWKIQEVLSSKSVWHGLQPEKYLSDTVIDRVVAMTLTTMPSKKDLVDLEILLTQVYWNFLKDMSIGRINPADPSQNLKDFEFPKMSAPAARMVAISTLSEANLENGIDLMSPPYLGYKYLQHSLADIEDAEKNGAWDKIPSTDVINPRDNHQSVVAIRQRLVTFRYLSVDERDNYSNIYDDKMVEAVKRFQKQHNLSADGKIGNGTYGILNRDISVFKNQIKANMEKWRFYPRGAEKFIMVDMGRQELDVMDRGSLVMTRRVVVGGEMTGTPTMADKVTSIKLAPDWTSPDSIMIKETIPNLGSKPSDYFAKANVEVIPRKKGEAALTPEQIDAVNWKQYTMQNLPPFYFRQKNGESSSLGLIKFTLTNRHSIYLHDTGNRDVFERDERYLSHGCIRVEYPFDLAAYLNPKMDKASDITKEELKMLKSKSPEDLRTFALDHAKQMNSRPFEVPVDQIPVYIFGTTTTTYPDGSIAFGRDIYKQDERIINALNSVMPANRNY